MSAKLTSRPLTPSRWEDFERLFGERGACGGCWCMWWRLKRSKFERQKGQSNQRAMRAIVDSGEVPGLLAYEGGRPIGWCSVAPRETFSVLGRSRILKPIDDTPVWSIVCFFVDKDHRREGVSVELLEAAADYVRRRGGQVLEGYPVEPKKSPMPAVFAYTGLASAFLKAGFEECARRSETRPIMRRYLSGSLHDS
ncbi:MAG: GNAT family N-acetyltransferase [Thermoanaerobaculia bacterium]